MHVFYEKTYFLEAYLAPLIAGFIMFGLVTFGWKHLLKYVAYLESRGLAEQNSFHQEKWFRIFISFCTFLCFMSIIKDAPDILSVLNQKHETKTAILTDVQIVFELDSGAQRFVTYFTVADKKFKLNRRKKEMEDLIGLELKVSYLPKSNTVMKIEIPSTEENLEKIDSLGIKLHRYSQR